MSAARRRIVVDRQTHTLFLYEGDRLDRSYPVLLGRNLASDKVIEGDEATPLGEFYICAKNPRSKYFLSMCISYPNAEDAERGLAANLITLEEHAQILAAIRLRITPPQRTGLGGEVYIHGHDPARGVLSPGHGTRGCIALDNVAMQELYERTLIGTPVVIV